MKTTNQHAQAPTQRTLRTEAIRALEDEVNDLFTDCERALLMAQDLVEDYFGPWSEDIGRDDREKFIMFYFEQNRIRAEILQDILFKVKATAKALRDAKA